MSVGMTYLIELIRVGRLIMTVVVIKIDIFEEYAIGLDMFMPIQGDFRGYLLFNKGDGYNKYRLFSRVAPVFCLLLV